MTDHFIPTSIRRLMDEFSKELGYPAEVQRLTGHRWRISVASPRVAVTLVYKPAQRGRAALVASTLAIDGQRVPLAQGLDHLTAIFTDPDNAGAPEEEPEPLDEAEQPMTLVSTCDPTEAPAEVQQAYHRFAAQLGRRGRSAAVTVGRDERGCWCVAIDSPRVSFRVLFLSEMRRGGTVRRGPTALQLFIDGHNRTREANGRLEKALGLVASALAAPTPSPQRPAARRGPATESNAVRERRHSVIRN